jgi:Ras-related protein Rab-7A
VTITPSLCARRSSVATDAQPTTPDDHNSFSPAKPPSPPERGPKLFFTSAILRRGVSDVFQYRMECGEEREREEARRMHIREASATNKTPD